VSRIPPDNQSRIGSGHWPPGSVLVFAGL